MKDEDAPILVYTTLENFEDAKVMGRALVEAGLAACVNIFPSMTAVYEWEGVCHEASEAAMLIKSRAGLQEELLAEARKLHPYEIPALLVFKPSGGDQDFMDWIVRQTKVHKAE